MGAAYGSAGERCMAVSVAVAVGNIADLVKKYKIKRTLKVPLGQIESGNGTGNFSRS